MPTCVRYGRTSRQRCTRRAVEWPGHREGFGQPATDWADLPRVLVCWTHLTSEERSQCLEARRRQGIETRATWAARRAELELTAAALSPAPGPAVGSSPDSEAGRLMASALLELAYTEYAMIEAGEMIVHPRTRSDGIRALAGAADPVRAAPGRQEGRLPAPSSDLGPNRSR